MFSENEKKRRLQAAAKLMNDNGFDVLYLLGNGIVGSNTFGNYRYFVDNRVTFNISNALVTKDARLICITGSRMSGNNLISSTFADEVIISPDQLGGVIEYFKENGIKRVGTLLEILPASWMLRIKNEIKDIELVDAADALFPLRLNRADEEVEVSLACGKIADEGYKALLAAVKPGMLEHEVVAACEGAMHKMGMDTSFMLIASGRFSASDNKLSTLHNAAGIDRRLESGDTVCMEITPNYNGYWTQLVRTVCIGEPNPDVDAFAEITSKSIEAASKVIKPGVKISEVAFVLKKVVEDGGYVIDMPLGHICGTDLNEERLTLDNDRELKKGMVVIMHPTVINDNIKTGIYWGESYVVTDDGCECVCGRDKTVYTAK